MNASINRISLDIQEAHSSVCLDAKRGDTNRKLYISLTDGGFPYHISEECYAVFSALKPDGHKVFNPCTIDGNTIIYELTPQTVAAEGLLECEIKLYGADDGLLTSACFSIVNNATVYNEGDEVQSETEVEALTHLISEATTAIHESRETTAEGKELIEDLENSREEFEQKVIDAKASAESAKQSEENAKASETASASSEAKAKASEEAAKASETVATNAEQRANDSAQNAADSEANAKTSEENAKKYADTIDTEQINANIATKADDLYFDSGTSLLYLMSNGQIIGTGVQVATTGGGGGGGTLTYTIAMQNLLDSRVITVSEGTKVELKFSYSSVDDGGVADGPGIGKIIVGNATRQTLTVVQGENTVDVTSYLAAGSNTVKVQVENSEGAKKTLSYTITVAAAHLTSTFDISAPFTGEINFTYVPTGIAEKTVHFELDGKEIGTATVTASGRQQSYPIPAQSHGSHTLRVWFDCEIEETPVTSNVLYFQIICIEEGNTTPVIAVNSQIIPNVEQYTNIVKKYRVYDPTSLTAAITLEANGETVANLTVDRTEQTWTYRPLEVGELEQTIRCGDEHASWSQTITESTIKVEAETEALALHLSSYGRSNNEANPGVWESGNVSAVFQNFNFVSDGWKQDDNDITVCRVTGDARLTIPYRMFAYDFRTTGKTIEFEMATREVLNYDAEVINCFSDGRGFTITAQQLRIASEQSELGTRYKEDEHIRVTFVAEKKSENRLLLCYINGIMSGAVQYPEDDDFSQANPVGITIGSNFCTTDLYNIRVYDNSLTRFQVLDNWIADTQNPEDRLARFLRNSIFDAYGRIVVSQLPRDLCYLVLQSTALPQFKGDKKKCSGYFVDLVNPDRSFSFKDAEIDVQGTSSQYYYRKNYKIKFKNGFILADESTVSVYQMNEDAVPVSTFTMKADVASSEGAFNVVLAMLYDDLCPFKTPAQEDDPRIRSTIEGFPMVIFWDNGSEMKFLGKYNFNNDKGTEEVFGFKSGDESWETLQNGTDRVGWHSADFSGDGWKTDFEARYPDKNTDITKLQQLAQWLVSTDTAQATGNPIEAVTYDGVEYTADTVEYRLAKFSAELADHFVEEAVIYYYLFTEMFLCIDQREKNAFPTYIADLDRWIVLFYDADSSLGTDNKGNLAFDYYLEDIDYTEAGDPVYNGQNSVLWKNLRATRYDQIMAMYQDMRNDGSLSYDSVIGRFEAHQSKWPEAIFNEDMYTKCLEPLIKDGDGLYLPMLQGKKEQWMKWWLYNRFRYLDSKYVTGSSMENRITIRAHQKANIFLKSYVNMYGHVYFNAAVAENRMERNREYEFEWPASGAEDPVIGINDADLMTSLGDLSPLMVELIDVSGAPHITSLKIGDKAEDYVNYSLNSVTLGNNILLRSLDMRNCVNLTQSVDASGCTNIEEVYFDGTSITGLTLPNGGILKTLHLPATVTNLTVLNQKAITDFTMAGYGNVTTLRVENTPSIPVLDILPVMPSNSRVRIIGLDVEASGDEVGRFISKLDSMRGLDENGNNVDVAQVSGKIHTAKVTYGQASAINKARETYPSLVITYDESGPAMTYQLVDRSISGHYENDRVDTVGASAFSNALTLDSVSFHAVTTIGEGAFEVCSKLLSADFPAASTVGNRAFYQCFILNDVNFPSLTTVGDQAFRFTGLECVPSERQIQTLGEYAFESTPVKTVVLPLVGQLKNKAFQNCKSLTFVDSGSATSITTNVFYNDAALETLILRKADAVTTLTNVNSFDGTPIASGTGYIYVPSALVDSYKAASNWSTFAAQIRAIEDYPEICGGE